MDESAPNKRAGAIAALNDRFRTRFIGGSVLITSGLQALGPEFVAEALAKVRAFNGFTRDNDPYGEHDFGTVMVQGRKLFWKIDCYDPSMRYGSEDPSDPEITRQHDGEDAARDF
ncbi:MAG: DUF3768 domain-containing protein, partial [Alphaproteobacteria bacterium]